MTARVWLISQVRPRLFGVGVLISFTLLFSSQLVLPQFLQQGSKPVYSYTTLNDPQALAAGSTVANGINGAGEIVGLYADSSGYHGFLYSGGKYTTLNVPLAPYTYAYGINNKGQIVGLFGGYGFLYSGGRYTTLSDPQGQFTQAYGINDKGQIVGQSANTRRSTIPWRRMALLSVASTKKARWSDNILTVAVSMVSFTATANMRRSTIPWPQTLPMPVESTTRARSSASTWTAAVPNTVSSTVMANIQRSMIPSGRSKPLPLASTTRAGSSGITKTSAGSTAFSRSL